MTKPAKTRNSFHKVNRIISAQELIQDLKDKRKNEKSSDSKVDKD